MAKSDRLFRLLHLLRTLPQPVTVARLAEEAQVSERTLYRDIEALRAGGALIDGAPGYGYILTGYPALPLQMFSRLEVEFEYSFYFFSHKLCNVIFVRFC